MKKRTIIIAEIGPNHNASLKIAKKLILEAKNAGADYVKFQTYITENIIIKGAEKANYQKKNSIKNENQFEMLKKLQLSFKDFEILNNYAKKQKIKFLTTCFDIKSVQFAKKFKMDYYKIPSGEINNFPLIKEICKSTKKIILSTGMSNFLEVKKAVNFILKNKIKKTNLIILHCNTEYPTPYEDINLNAMTEMSKKLKINKFGYSDHSLGDIVPLAAASMGAAFIEKHFTLSCKMAGPDHKASMEPNKFKEMIKKIRIIEKVLGSKKKFVSNSEKKNKLIARRSIVADQKIRKGEKFSFKNLAIKRPGSGIEPNRIFSLIGKKSNKNFEKDEFIK